MASKRFVVSWLGEYYMDCLEVEAALKDRTRAMEGSSLLCSLLQQRDEKRQKMVQYLADKRGIPYEEMWSQLRDGNYTPITKEEREIIEETE